MTRLASAVLLVAVVGCASADPQPPAVAAAPPPTVLPAPPAAVTPAPPPPTASAPAPEAAPPTGSGEPQESRPSLTVLEIPETETAPGASRDLVAAARAERKRRGETAQPTVVIDQDSLADYAHIEITVAEAAGGSGAAGSEATAEGGDARERAGAYWRERVLEPRRRWREAHDSIERLEGEIDQLRRRFYAEDDPYYRDSQVKPAWDRALDEVRAARREVEQAKLDLTAALEEGRRASAEPGWLREGVDLQPETFDFPEGDAYQVEETGIYEPAEPTVRERRRNDGGGPAR